MKPRGRLLSARVHNARADVRQRLIAELDCIMGDQLSRLQSALADADIYSTEHPVRLKRLRAFPPTEFTLETR